MTFLHDSAGHELSVGSEVELAREIEMERLFGGYDAALAGRPLPRDLALGDVGVILGAEEAPEGRIVVEFSLGGEPFWRGALRPDEVRRRGV